MTVVSDLRRDLKGMINGEAATDVSPAVLGLGEGVQAQWLNQDRGMKDPCIRAFFLLSIDNWRKDQFAELTTTTVDVTNQAGQPDKAIVFTITGQRRFVLVIRCESDSQDDENIAFNYMDDLMTNFESQRGRDLLTAANLTIVDFDLNGAINVDEPIDERWRSHSELRVEMRAGFCKSEPPNNCWIQKVLSSSFVSNVDLSVLPVPPNWKDLLIDGGI